jgi:hypothetical protein
VKDWLQAAGIKEGPVFRLVAGSGTVRAVRLTDKSVGDIVKAYAGRVALNVSDFGDHSLQPGSSRWRPIGM